jgi:hypothetical protein
MINPSELAQFGHHGDGHGAWHTAPGVQRLDHRVQAPGFHVIVSCLFEALEAFGRLMNRTAICLKDEVRRWCGTDHRRAPAEVGRAPLGPAHIPDILSQQQGFQTALGVFAIAEGLFTRPGAIAKGCIFDCGDIDGGEIT